MGFTPRTYMAGSSSPEDAREQRQQLAAAVALMFLIAPIGTIVAWATYQVGLVRRRYRWQQLAAWAGVWLLVWLILRGPEPLHSYTTGWRELADSVRDGTLKGTVADRWTIWLSAQLPLGWTFGTVAGAGYSAFRWWRRPQWLPDDRRETPLVRRRRAKTIKNIIEDVDGPGPRDGVTLGYNEATGERVIQTPAAAAAHTLVTGKSGTGKTTGLVLKARDVIRFGQALIFIDVKGSSDVPPKMAQFAAQYGREFHHWKMHDRATPYTGPAEQLSYYEPIGRGDSTRRAQMLLATRQWSVEADHYRATTEGFLQALFNLIDLAPAPAGVDTISDVVTLSTSLDHLSARAQAAFDAHPLHAAPGTELDGWGTAGQVPHGLDWLTNYDQVADPEVRATLNAIASFITVTGASGKRNLDETIKGFGRSLSTFKQSVAGPWLASDPTGRRDIDLARACLEGHVIVFSLDSSNYAQMASAVAGMIIQDLKTVSSELRANPVWDSSADPRDQAVVLIDEFGRIESENLGGLLSQARDSKIAVTLASQSIGDLAKHSPAYKEAVMNTISSFVIHCCNTADEAEELAGLTGAVEKQVLDLQVEQASSLTGMSTGAATGGGRLRTEVRPVIEPAEFQSLHTFESVYITAAAGPRQVVKVKSLIVEARPGAVAAELPARMPAAHEPAAPAAVPQSAPLPPRPTAPIPVAPIVQTSGPAPSGPAPARKPTPPSVVDVAPTRVVRRQPAAPAPAPVATGREIAAPHVPALPGPLATSSGAAGLPLVPPTRPAAPAADGQAVEDQGAPAGRESGPRAVAPLVTPVPNIERDRDAR